AHAIGGRMSVKTIVAQRPGKLSEVLTQREITRSQPLGEGQIDVRMTASTVNPSDVVTVSGAYASRTEFPFVPGFEGVGVIERVGPGVPANAIGERTADRVRGQLAGDQAHRPLLVRAGAGRQPGHPRLLRLHHSTHRAPDGSALLHR